MTANDDPTPGLFPDLSPGQVRAQLRKLARQQGLDPALAESALDPEKHIPTELMDLLTEIADHLLAGPSHGSDS